MLACKIKAINILELHFYNHHLTKSSVLLSPIKEEGCEVMKGDAPTLHLR